MSTSANSDPVRFVMTSRALCNFAEELSVWIRSAPEQSLIEVKSHIRSGFLISLWFAPKEDGELDEGQSVQSVCFACSNSLPERLLSDKSTPVRSALLNVVRTNLLLNNTTPVRSAPSNLTCIAVTSVKILPVKFASASSASRMFVRSNSE